MKNDKVRKSKFSNAKKTVVLLAALCILFSMSVFALSACHEKDDTDITDEIINDGTVALYGIIGDTNVHYTQDKYKQILGAEKNADELTGWKGDMALSQIVLISENAEIKNVSVGVGDFSDGANIISASQVDVSFIDETLAYTGNPSGHKPSDTPAGTKDKQLVPDIISGNSQADIPRNTVKSIWLEINIPRNAVAGVYHGTVTVTGDGVNELTFDYSLEVQDAELPLGDFGIELWQYPYSVAEYYKVEPFSGEHLEILKKHMQLYKDIGADGITCSIVDEAWGGQTYSANDIRYPSMVKWTKQKNGEYTYDYSDLDAWISLNKELGLGNKIVLYSIATWSGRIRYFDVDKNKTFTLVPTFGSVMWTHIWKNFLRDLITHLEDKGWFDDAYMGVDERGFSEATLNIIESVKSSDGRPIKTTGAFNDIDNPEKVKLANRIDDISVGTKAIKANPEAYEKLVADRKAMGKTTTVYTCTTHFPNNLALNMPGESYWIAFYCALQNADGYMRWAFDAWVKDPLHDTTHWNYEAGDCFQIYPGDSGNGYTPRMSVRLAKLLEGIRDINKLRYMASVKTELADDVAALLATLKLDYSYDTYKKADYADSKTLEQLPKDMAALKEGVRNITAKFLES